MTDLCLERGDQQSRQAQRQPRRQNRPHAPVGHRHKILPLMAAIFPFAALRPTPETVGRVAAEPASPYPPGVPAVCPGARINRAVMEYLKSGVDHGMYVPDPSDPELRTLRVVAR